MPTTTVSIGTRSAENVDMTAVAGSGPYTVTLAAATTDTANGDTLTDEAGNIYLITAGEGTDSLTVTDVLGAGVAPATGASQASTARTFSNLTDFESATSDTTLFPTDEIAKCEIHGESDQAGNVTFNEGAQLSGLVISVYESDRHDGTAGSGAAVTGAIITYRIGGRPVTIEWIEFKNSRILSPTGPSGDTDVDVQNCLSYGGAYSLVAGVSVVGIYDYPLNAMNNIIYDFENASSGHMYGIALHTRGKKIYNNTVHDLRSTSGTVYNYFYNIDGAGMITKNCIGTDPSSAGTAQCYSNAAPTSMDMDYNIASDATAYGDNSQNNITAASLYISAVRGAEDLHIRSTSVAIEAGTYLTTPADTVFDIDGFDRTGFVFDAGADQLSRTVRGAKYFPTIDIDIRYVDSPREYVLELPLDSDLPFIMVRLLNGDAVVDVSAATVTFSMDDESGTSKIASATGYRYPQTSGQLYYPWAAGDLDTAGVYFGQFKVTIGSTYYLVPNNQSFRLRIEVKERIN